MTEKQRQIFASFRQRHEARLPPPSHAELAKVIGVRSVNGVAEHLNRLVRDGYLVRGEKGRARCYSLSELGARFGVNGEAPPVKAAYPRVRCEAEPRRLDNKRVYLDAVVSDRCPRCGRVGKRDLDDWCLTYPVVNQPSKLDLSCEHCEHEWSVPVVIEFKIRLAEPGEEK